VTPLLRQVLNLLMLVVVLAVNGMAGAGTISGESIGLIANRYTSFFLPANYVFGIWSLIYLGLTAFALFQALPAKRGSPVLERLGSRWLVNGLLNMAWVVLFSFSLFGLALVVMLALLWSLIGLTEAIRGDRGPETWGERALISWVFDLYLAWISVAVIANTFQYMTYLEWGGWGISGETWSAVMMVVATALGAFMVFHRGNWIFPPVVAWALWGIRDRFLDVPVLATTALAMIPAGLMALVVGLWWRSMREADAGGPDGG
jgi:benzodiazapine receptor